VLQRFITQYHTIFFTVFLGLSIGLAYSIGLEAGKRRTDGAVTLSCPSLEALSLPIQEKEGGIQQPRVEGTSTEAVSKGCK